MLVCHQICQRVTYTTAGIMIGLGMVSAIAHADDELIPLTFGTNWYAQAEHGGFYQAVAKGIYEEYGLDVTIEQGGPQVNNLQLLLAGNQDFTVGYPIRAIKARAEGAPVVTVAAAYQADPQGFISHSHFTSMDEIAEEAQVMISSAGDATFWPWLKAEFGFSDERKQPYTYSLAPFFANEDIVPQTYATSEPYEAEQEGVDFNVFVFADYGFPPYANTIETTENMVGENPEIVRAFVKASMKGWQSYLDNPEPGNALIREFNPEMSDGQIEYSYTALKEHEFIAGGDATEHGIGFMTDQRWEETYRFLADEGLIESDVNWESAYTLQFLPTEPVLPAGQ